MEKTTYSGRRLRTPEAATYVGLRPGTLERMRVTGDGPVYEKPSGIVLYSIQALEDWLAAGRRCSTSAAGAPRPEAV